MLTSINFARSSLSVGAQLEIRVDNKHLQVCGTGKAASIDEHTDRKDFFLFREGQTYMPIVPDFFPGYALVATCFHLSILL